MTTDLVKRLLNKQAFVSVVGLGYVGMPIAIAFAKKVNVIGYDLNEEKISQYRRGIDATKEVGNDALKATSAFFTSDPSYLKKAVFHIVAVPTPLLDTHLPDLRPVESACAIVGKNLEKGSIVVFESTVYPGVTEEICVPILEKASGMRCGKDFKVGYSPERINPGDPEHRLETITKVVSAMDEDTLDVVADVYRIVVNAGIFKAESIRVAEAAKVIENAQRDINIAFMNELSIMFNKMDIDTCAVLAAARTKWNFLPFSPGLVGGHCIGVDPYYLTYRAEQLGYHSQIVLAGRKINDNMGNYVVENVIKHLILEDVSVRSARVAILGFTFKENCPDTRNTKVVDIVNELAQFGITPVIADPQADQDAAKEEYGIAFEPMTSIQNMDAVILAVGHREFLSLRSSDIAAFFKATPGRARILADIKGILNKKDYPKPEYIYWRL